MSLVRSSGRRPDRCLAGRALRAGLLAGAAGALLGCSAEHDWREVRPDGSAAVLLMPCRPRVEVRSVTLAGRRVQWALSACQAGGQTWALGWADLGAQVPADIVGEALGELARAARANLGSEAAALLPLAVRGSAVHARSARWALRGRLPDGRPVVEQVAVFAQGGRVFQATVLGERLPAHAAETFFESLRTGP